MLKFEENTELLFWECDFFHMIISDPWYFKVLVTLEFTEDLHTTNTLVTAHE